MPAILRHSKLRQDYAAGLTDALRVELLEACGYHVDAIEFVGSQHTPKNLLLRAHRRHPGAPVDPARWRLDPVRARDEMVAVVSHDIRSPLQTIMTACSILDLDVPEPRKAQSRAMIRRAVGQMERLTTDLLDISRIEAGGIQLHCGEVDAAALLVEVGAAFQATADASLIRLEVTVEPGLPRLWADRDRLLQVLSNLLGNAFKFTPQGGRIGLRALRCDMGVRLVVSDTGCGIPPDHVPRLFERYWQADRKRGPGAGLGLAIVKGLVEGHGGVVEVESTVGAGSTFSVSLPVRSPAPLGVGSRYWGPEAVVGGSEAAGEAGVGRRP